MKKNLFILLGIFIVIITILFYFYINYRNVELQALKLNKEYEMYTKDEILGSSLITVINKAIDQNEKNGIEKDEKNRYISNDKNSIIIEVKFLESDKTFTMEAISKLGIDQFIKNYSNRKFKCTKEEHHSKTNYIKYLLFEEI